MIAGIVGFRASLPQRSRSQIYLSKFQTMESQVLYSCVCGTKLRFPDLKKKIKVTCPKCNNFYFFEDGKSQTDNFMLIAKNITYCYEAYKHEFPNEKEATLLLWGTGLATQQYRLAGQITLENLVDVITENETDFTALVTKIIILELAADCPNIPLNEIIEITHSQKQKISKAIEQAQKEFPTVNNEMTQHARYQAKTFKSSPDLFS